VHERERSIFASSNNFEARGKQGKKKKRKTRRWLKNDTDKRNARNGISDDLEARFKFEKIRNKKKKIEKANNASKINVTQSERETPFDVDLCAYIPLLEPK
jgi:hypothetical protein